MFTLVFVLLKSLRKIRLSDKDLLISFIKKYVKVLNLIILMIYFIKNHFCVEYYLFKLKFKKLNCYLKNIQNVYLFLKGLKLFGKPLND